MVNFFCPVRNIHQGNGSVTNKTNEKYEGTQKVNGCSEEGAHELPIASGNITDEVRPLTTSDNDKGP